ncbi:Dynamin central region-domain-containing protein [Mycena belliarum]|uniref:Dynamin central region-domain-containing protein n=1 Tax=Mycena belliarum TaxID=1033014 RepID=A0AAD6U1F8_9AGAR|nr:Dynamin central region-domain-containing protein [Mycena belliae]
MATGPSGLGIEIVSTISKLQDVFTPVGLASAAQADLPQICVLGSQSSGKSSVLENIVGRHFLPCGSGIVTQRPLVIQLTNRPASAPAPSDNGVTPARMENDKNASQDEWGEFLHLPGQKFYDFNKIREEIVREANAARKTGISLQPINLRIFSPNVSTLTLVDLPGVTKVPSGDQPPDIDKQIRDMLMEFIANPACIILAITDANEDLDNSEGLQMALEVDPEGTRTIGVLTKVDLMDAGADVVDILAGRIIPLRLGYVPVVNRGQHDIDSNRPISYTLENEREFFKNHPSYRDKAQYCGTSFLAQKLNRILNLHIRNTLSDIQARITQELQKFTAELQTLGGPLGSGGSANVVLSDITKFMSEFKTVIDENPNDLSVNEPFGARISFVFHELFNKEIMNMEPFELGRDNDLRSLLYSFPGSTPSRFVAMAVFLVKHQIMRLEGPSLKCCRLVYDELITIVGQILTKIETFRRHPALRERFNSVVVNFLKNSMGPTTKLVSDMVAMQACYINTAHPDFIDVDKAMTIVNDRMNANKPLSAPAADLKLAPGQINTNRELDVEPKEKNTLTMEAAHNERETMEIEVIKLLIHSYFNIVKRELIDTVPKAISLTLVTNSTKNLQRELLQELYL